MEKERPSVRRARSSEAAVGAALHKSSVSGAGWPFDPDTGVWKVSSVCGPTLRLTSQRATRTLARPVGTFACTVTA